MSEEGPAYPQMLQWHLRTQRAPEEVATAFLDAFSSPPGKVALDAMIDAFLLAQVPYGQEMRYAGRQEVVLFVIDTMTQGHLYRTQGPRQEI